jgi:acetolactate synthase-1/2/3 large subunit
LHRLSGGEILVYTLKREGIDYVFGVPGAELTPILDALHRIDGISFIHTRHEQAAANIADAYFRVSGRTAACMATVGPGAANLVSGVYPAYADGIPMVVITAQHQLWKSYPDHGSMQALDQYTLFKAVTKWNAVVNHISRIPEVTQRGIRVSYSGRMGPIHLDLPVDILFQEYNVDNLEQFIPSPKQYRAVYRPIGDIGLIKKAARMLVEAELPLIHAGCGVLWSEAYEEIRLLAEYLSAPVTTSLAARGVLPEDHPLLLYPASPGALAAQNNADIVLLVGGRLGDIDFWGMPPGWGSLEDQRFIQIDIDPEMIALNRPVELAIVGDAKGTLKLLIEEVRSLSDKIDRDLSMYRGLTQEWEEDKIKKALKDYDGIHPMRAIYEIRRVFPRNAICVVDGGNVPVWAYYINRIYMPRSYLWAADSGHLGTGLPYAIGAKIAAPDRDVFLITGDGSLMFNIHELETAARLGLKINVFVLNDRAYGMIKGVQKLMFKERYIGVDFHDVRYDKVAEAMGWVGVRVEEPEELSSAINNAYNMDSPVLLDIVTPTELSVEPPELSLLGAIWLEGCTPPER